MSFKRCVAELRFDHQDWSALVATRWCEQLGYHSSMAGTSEGHFVFPQPGDTNNRGVWFLPDGVKGLRMLIDIAAAGIIAGTIESNASANGPVR